MAEPVPDRLYLDQLGRLANGLRAVASEVERHGQPAVTNGNGSLNHVHAALAAVRQVMAMLYRLPVPDLIDAAMVADHPTARLTPGQMLDRATCALVAATANSEDIDWPGFDPEALSEAALRGAGMIR